MHNVTTSDFVFRGQFVVAADVIAFGLGHIGNFAL